MQIWVDADACPRVIKDILYRAAERTGLLLTLIANQALLVPPSRFIRARVRYLMRVFGGLARRLSLR